MKFHSFLLSLVLILGLSLSSSFAQDNKQQTQTPSSQTQPAAQPVAPAQSQTPAADQKPAATDPSQDQGQNQPVANQEQPTADQGKDSDKTDKKDKDKKDKKETKKHSGGKDDVDAIGNRKVAGWDWYSIESEIRMGKQYATQIEASLKMVTDPPVHEYVNRIGQHLVRNSDAKVPFTIKVVDSDSGRR